MKNIRHSVVEPVIGTLVNIHAMKKVNCRGIKQANKHMIGAAIAYNLKKWLKWKVAKPQVAVITKPKQDKPYFLEGYLSKIKHNFISQKVKRPLLMPFLLINTT